MKIWIVNHYAIPPKLGGLVRHYYFSKLLGKSGHSCEILTSSKIHNKDLNFADEIKNGKISIDKKFDDVKYTFIKTSDYTGNGLKRIFTFIQYPINIFRFMRRKIKHEVPDAIYASSPELFSTYVATLFARKHKIPLIVEIRDLWPESIVAYTNFSNKNFIIKILYHMEKYIYSKADRLIFTFEGGRDYIVNKKWNVESGGPISLDKIRYINNGIDLDEFEINAKKLAEVVDKELDNPNKFKVVYTGSIRRVNAVYMIVEAAKRLNEMGIDDISFIIYGDGTEKKKLIDLVDKFNLNNIFFRDSVEKKRVPTITKRADVNIMVGEPDSLTQYGMSANKLFDYMASGKPVLSNIKTNYDNILKYTCGIVVGEGSIDNIVDGILRIKNMSEEEYNQLCNNARTAAMDFDYKLLTNKLLNVLLEINNEINH